MESLCDGCGVVKKWLKKFLRCELVRDWERLGSGAERGSAGTAVLSTSTRGTGRE